MLDSTLSYLVLDLLLCGLRRHVQHGVEVLVVSVGSVGRRVGSLASAGADGEAPGRV